MTPKKICKIDGCGKVGPIRRGWCSAHYTRWLAHGDPLGGGPSKGECSQWINEVALTHEDRDACLKWPYSTDGAGYGKVVLDGRLQRVSRIVCEAIHGPPPTPDHEAAHSCGKGHEACCNQWHLGWKTPVENNADKIEHDTHKRGERHPMVKLGEPDIHEIRRLADGGMKQSEIAKMFGMSAGAICMIVARKRWDWLKMEGAA